MTDRTSMGSGDAPAMHRARKVVRRSRPGWLRWVGSLLACAVAATLVGCAATKAFKEGKALLAQGQTEQGLAKLEQAVKLDPKNTEYRIALTGRRAAIVSQWVAGGDALRRAAQLTEAEKAYREALRFDPANPMAQQGLEALDMQRRHRRRLNEAEASFKRGEPTDLDTALEILRSVLAEDPKQDEALNLKARIDEQRAQALKPEAKLAAVYKKPITLEFRDAPLKSVFDLIAKLSGLNFYFDKDIRPDLKATILAKNTSIEDAVRLLLVTNQLEQQILNANSVLIYPSTPQKQNEYQTLSVRSFYVTNADVKAVSNSIKTIVKTKDLVTDERLGIIIMRDTPEAIRIAERIVALQDLGDPEVMLELEVMEIKRSRLLELGIQWPSQLTLAPLQAGGTSGAPLTLDALRNLNSSTIQATIGNTTLNARKEDQDGNTLANPRIRVRNKEKAKILIGDRVPVITTTSTSTGFVSESVSYVDVGLKLEVEPTIYLDEDVAIKVNLEVSSLVREVLSSSGTLAYQIGTRGASTVLRLKDGETQILAGLISDEERTTANKLPGLGELPIVGRLFGSQKDDVQRSEILLSITPRILRAIRRPDLLAAEFESGTGANIGSRSLRLGTVEAAVSSTAGTKPAGALAPVPASATTDAGAPTDASATRAPASFAATAASSGALTLSWQAPAQVKVGEQFSAVLHLSSQAALRGMPVLIGFDPQLLQVVTVQEGDFFKQSGGTSSFNYRIDPTQGKVFVAAVRQSASNVGAGVNGAGAVVTVAFKALKPDGVPAASDITAKLQLLSASPEPAPASPFALPVEHMVHIVP